MGLALCMVPEKLEEAKSYLNEAKRIFEANLAAAKTDEEKADLEEVLKELMERVLPPLSKLYYIIKNDHLSWCMLWLSSSHAFHLICFRI